MYRHILKPQLTRKPWKAAVFVILLLISSAFFCLSANLYRNSFQNLQTADDTFSTVAYFEVFGYPAGYQEALQTTGKTAADPILTVADDFDFDAISCLPGATSVDLRRKVGGYIPDALPFYEEEDSELVYTYDLIRFVITEEAPVIVPAQTYVAGAGNAHIPVELQITYSANGVFSYESNRYALSSKTALTVRNSTESNLSPAQIAMHSSFNKNADVSLGDLVLEPGIEYLAAVECRPVRNQSGLFTVPEDSIVYITFDWYGARRDFLPGKRNTLSVGLWDQAAEDQPIGIWRWEDIRQDAALSAYFEEVANAYRYSARSFPVMTTSDMNGIYAFHQQTAYITEGRAFLADEYKTGKYACIVSDKLATLQGWCIGDTVDLSLYKYDGLRNEWATKLLQFTQRGGGFFDRGEYTIVGIWTETSIPSQPILQAGTTVLSWNTILVPASSVQNLDTVETPVSGSRLTVHLENGMMEEFLEAASKVTLSESADEVRITAFDQGYSQAQDSLQSMLGTAQFLLVLSSVLLVVAGVLLAFFYTQSQKQNMALMRLLGCSRRQAGTMAMLGSLLILLPGGILGTAAGHLLTDRVASAILRGTSSFDKPEYAGFREIFGVQAEVEFALSAQPAVSLLALAAAAGLFLLGCLLFTLLLLRKEPREALQDQ